MSGKNSKKVAVIFSYITLFLSTISSFLLTPYLLKKLGVDAYGLYQMIYSVAHYILILDLGFSAVAIRYISEYRARKQEGLISNFLFMVLVLVLITIIIVITIALFVDCNIERIYSSLATSDYAVSHTIFRIMIIQIIVTIFNNMLMGIIIAFERFYFSNIISFFKVIFSFLFTIVLVESGMGILGIVTANTIVVFIELIASICFLKTKLNIVVKYSFFDVKLLKSVLLLMFAMMLQSIVGHVNGMVDKTILGIYSTKQDVAIYSVAATVLTMFNTIPTLISKFFQPQSVKLVVSNASSEQLTEYVASIGRWQFMLCSLFMVAFILFGEDFIKLWVGEKMLQSWKVIMIIMPFNMMPLVQTACIGILNAMDKRIDRSLILICITIINIIVSVLLVREIGLFGAPIGTALSYFLGYFIILNFYYYKVINLKIIKMYKLIFNRIFLCAIATFLLGIFLTFWHSENFLVFVLKVAILSIIFVTLLFVYGFDSKEKNALVSVFKLK